MDAEDSEWECRMYIYGYHNFSIHIRSAFHSIIYTSFTLENTTEVLTPPKPKELHNA